MHLVFSTSLENRKKFFARTGVNPEKAVKMELIHGNRVVAVSPKDSGKRIRECDGLVTNSPGLPLALPVADCLPIAFFDPVTKSIGLAHAGWRGLQKEIIKNTVLLLQKDFGVEPTYLEVLIGAHICPMHYEVKDDVLGKLKNYSEAINKKDGKEFLDLGKVAQMQLLNLGVKKENIETDGRCTFENEIFFSYRRNHTSGRNLYILSM